MDSTVELAGLVVVHQEPKSDLSLPVQWPIFGPFPAKRDWTGMLSASGESEVIDLGGLYSLLVLSLSGAADFEFDYNGTSVELDQVLHFCGFGPCPQTGPQVGIMLPVCGIEHLKITANPECGVQWDLMAFGVSPPSQQA
jgi:hypothetical protein